jgi:hypothetical protein
VRGLSCRREQTSAPRHRLQALEGQALGVLHASEIKRADEGDDLLAVATGQRDHGIDGNSLGVQGFLMLT